MIEINGMPWEPVDGARYKYDYEGLVVICREKPEEAFQRYRLMILDDLWFVLYFVMRVPVANKAFVVNACREIEDGPDSDTLDLWAREHFKSSIITQAETLQYALKWPERTSCILSYAKDPARDLARPVKHTFEQSEFLHACFPDILYGESIPSNVRWNDSALTVKRRGNPKEATIECHGLIDGQPIGKHFDRLIYDDVVTDRVVSSPEVMRKVQDSFDLSNSLGKDGGTRRVVGTFYHHSDPLTYISKIKDKVSDELMFTTRIKPVTVDGSLNGELVLLSPEYWRKLRAGDPYIVNCQYLLNPTPISEQTLHPDFLREVEIEDIPEGLFKFMTVDPAGMQTETKRRGDSWALMVIGVRPNLDDVGASDIYLLDMMIEPMNEADSMDNVVDMYQRNGRIRKLGVEKVAMTTMEIHIANALRTKGIHLSLASGTLALLTPAGRPKQTRIERNLMWPLRNGKIHISKAIPAAYRDRLKTEMEKFPHWHDDALDALSYVYDLLADFHFTQLFEFDTDEEDTYERYKRKFESKFGAELNTDEGWLVV